MLALGAVLATSGCGGSDRGNDGGRDSATTSPPGKTTTTGTTSARTPKSKGSGHAGNAPARPSSPTTTSPTKGQPSRRSSGLEGSAGSKFPGVYAEALRVCSQGTVEKVAQSVGIKSTNRAQIARAMAHGYLPRFRKQAFAGCSAGLKIAAGLK
jgi:hypothetical protein